MMEISRSPYTIMARVLGIGVALITSKREAHCPLVVSASLCFDAEAVLLVCDDKAKVFVNHLLLDQGVGANDHVGLAGCNLSVDSPLLFQEWWSR